MTTSNGPEHFSGPPTDGRFEVTLPPGDDERYLALAALVRELGGDIRAARSAGGETNPEPTGDYPITSRALTRASNELWGSPTYGDVAALLLETNRDQHTDGLVDSEGRYTAKKQRGLGFTIATGLDPTHNVAAQIRPHWDRLHLPFDVRVEEFSGGARVSPSIVTAHSLANFVRWRDNGHHELHGTLGKALDVMTVAAGIRNSISPHLAEPEAEVRGGFVPAEELLTAMDRTLNGDQRRALFAKLTSVFEDQYQTATPDKAGELVLEGAITYKREGYVTGNTIRFDSIAVESLRSLMTYFRQGAVRSFLQDLTEAAR